MTKPAHPIGPYFKVGDVVLMGKYKSARGVIVGFGVDQWGNPTVEIEPSPKGRRHNKIIGLYKIWLAALKEGVQEEQRKPKRARRVSKR